MSNIPRALLLSMQQEKKKRSSQSQPDGLVPPPLKKIANLPTTSTSPHPSMPISSNSRPGDTVSGSRELLTMAEYLGPLPNQTPNGGEGRKDTEIKGEEPMDLEEGEISDDSEIPPNGPSPPATDSSVTPGITPDPPSVTPEAEGMTVEVRGMLDGVSSNESSSSPELPDGPEGEAVGRENHHESWKERAVKKEVFNEDSLPAAYRTRTGGNMEPLPSERSVDDKGKIPKAMLKTLCPKPKPGKLATVKVPLRVNMFPLRIPENTTLYRYQVTVTEMFRGKQRVLTKGAPDDFHREQKRSRCYDLVMREVVKKNKEFFGEKQYAVVYDRQNIFYSKAKIDIGLSKTFQVKGEDDNELLVRFEPGEPETLSLTDFRNQLSLRLTDRDRSVTQAMELMTSQVLFYRDEYKCFGGNFYDNTARRQDLGDGKCLAEGLQKSVKIVDGPEEQPEPVTILDLKKTAFFKPQQVIQTLLEICQIRCEQDLDSRGINDRQYRIFREQIKDVVVRVRYGPRERTLTVNGLSDKGANEIDLEFNDAAKGCSRRITVAEYFHKKYQKRLRFAKLPCLVEKRGKQTNYYPMELCEVTENQRVPLKKQSDIVTRALIKAAAVPPIQRQQQIQDIRDKARLTSNRHLSALGAKMSSKMVKVKGRILPLPIIEYKSNKTVRVDNRGTWEMHGSRWLVGGKCGKWAVIWLEDRCDERVIKSFINAVERGCEVTGTKMGRLIIETYVPPEGLEAFFREALRTEVEYVLCIVSDRKDKFIHDKIKLGEIQHHIQTQSITWNILRQCSNVELGRGGPRKFVDIFTKFLSKTNAKLGGTNYSVHLEDTALTKKWFREGVMYVGVDVSHPPPQSRIDKIRGIPPSEPSVVGFVANTAESCFHFTGDYRYQNGRVEVVVEGIDKLMRDFLQRYREPSKTKALPERIVYFRDGVSDGQFLQVLENEIYLVEKACRRVGGEEYRPKITALVVQKRHPVRFFPTEMEPRAKPPDQNIPYGTVVDKHVVDPTKWEFYLCSHRAVQGTTKVPKYTVIRDDNQCTADELQQVCYVLAHGHQIITQTVSLPAPSYGAHELANRGKRLYLAKQGQDDTSRYGSDDREPRENTWEELNAELSTKGTVFATKKHWA